MPKAERLESDRKVIGCSRYSRWVLGAGLEDEALRKRRYSVDERCRSELGCIGAPGDATRDRISRSQLTAVIA
jgi:hypothetical protein